MKHSADRILTTHVRSRPRSTTVTEYVFAHERREAVSEDARCSTLFAGFGAMDPDTVYAKHAAFAAGARIGSESLWK